MSHEVIHNLTGQHWDIEVTEESPNGLIVGRGGEDVIAEIQGNGQTAVEIMAYARLIIAAPDMFAALSQIDCPLCDHPLGLHADKYGCEREMGDLPGNEDWPAEAKGPCCCKGGTLEDVQRVIAAIRKAKGQSVGRQKEEGIA